MTKKKENTSTKILELESIRGLAAILVVFAHLPKWNSVMDISLFNNATLVIDLFFVISGFVIFNAYAENIKTKKDLLRFQFLRFGRLYPIHLLFLLIFLGIEFAKYIASKKFGIYSPNSIPFEKSNLEAFIKNIFLISSVLPNQQFTYNEPSWSISVEFYTYLIFGISMLFIKKKHIILFIVLSSVSLFLLITEKTYGFYWLLRCFVGFFIGCLTAKLTKNLKLDLPKFYSLIFFFVIVGFIQFKTTNDYDFLVFFFSSALIITVVISPNGILNKILKFKFLTSLGAISYSVYMSHAAVIWVVNQIIRVVVKKTESISANGQSIPQLSQLENFFACLSVIVITLIVSTLTYYFIEKPMREKSRELAFNKLT